MAGQKRTRSGEPKPQSDPKETPTISTSPCGQAQAHSSKPSTTTNPVPQSLPTKKPRTKATSKNTYVPHIHGPLKRPRLPPNATISKRPLLHPAIPTPFSSAASPKVLYITASSPFIPTCKRVRALLVQIRKREAQSAASASASRSRGGAGKSRNGGLEANGRLEARDVEASIAGAAKEKKGHGQNAGGEEVFLKATGRAIPRALELGVKFQGEDDCRVRVEMGSVKAIDDVEVKEDAEVDRKGTVEGEEAEEDEEVPETRIRTLSTVTVCIGLK